MLGILASIIDGVLVGLVYGLAAMGLTLIWGVMDVINLTHGAMIVAGMFALYLLTSALGISPYAALPPVMIGGFFVGLLLYWIAVHRMIGRPPLMSLLSTFSVNLVLIGVGTAVWGTALFNVEVSVPGLSIGRYTFPGPHILAAVLAAVIACSLYFFLHYTRFGKAIRAVANNREAAELVAIPTTRVLAVVGRDRRRPGRRIGNVDRHAVSIHRALGGRLPAQGFIVTVLGGLGNPVGALIGGVALGLLEGLVAPFVPVSWTLVIEFTLFVAGADRVSGRRLRVKARSALMAAPAVILDHHGRDRDIRDRCLCSATMLSFARA